MKKIIKLIKITFKLGFIFAFKSILYRIYPSFFRKSTIAKDYKNYFLGKNGIEIGGPSEIFQYELPIYKWVNHLDGCNFSTKTVWEGDIAAGKNYNFYKDKNGYQFISEASKLKDVPDNSYDFLVASHCLEHCANPIGTVKEWLRVLENSGIILLILPHKDFTFDRERMVTDFNHLLDDFKLNMGEEDLTHLQEILKYHDLSLDSGINTKNEFEVRSLDNFQNRCLHHHVYDFDLLEKIFDFLMVNVIRKDFVYPYHQIIIGKKTITI